MDLFVFELCPLCNAGPSAHICYMEHQHRTLPFASGIDHMVDVWPISAEAEAEMLHWQSVTPAEASGLPYLCNF